MASGGWLALLEMLKHLRRRNVRFDEIAAELIPWMVLHEENHLRIRIIVRDHLPESGAERIDIEARLILGYVSAWKELVLRPLIALDDRHPLLVVDVQ